MKHTKKNVIKVIEAMMDTKFAMRNMYLEEGNETKAKHYLKEYMALETAKLLLVDKKFFDAMAINFDVIEDKTI